MVKSGAKWSKISGFFSSHLIKNRPLLPFLLHKFILLNKKKGR